ncbi:MAG: autotransporter domain-containing protein [Gammaproteobacteria bacterium]|nr:autotransporter domain-containing protein [Gammaproteobacteria bacterium]
MKTSLPILVILSMLTPSQSVIAADYTIDTDVTTTNGGNTLDGNDTLTITSSGSISTSGAAAVLGTNSNTVNNDGSITAVNGHGFELDEYSVANNSGTINVSGTRKSGIYIKKHGSANNSGTILTSGERGHGINIDNYSSANNSGTILTSGEIAYGIYMNNHATLINSGSINTSGDKAHGIYVWQYSSVTNSGTITTSGDEAHGIKLDVYNTAINTGTITTSGSSSNGVVMRGDTTFSNFGSVKVSGTNSYALGTDRAESITINNSGSVEATNTGSYAIYNDDAELADTTLNLKTGSTILGTIDLGNAGGDIDIVNIYGGSPSARLTILNAEQINLYGAGIVNGTTVTTVDATVPTAQGLASANLSNSVHGTVNQRMAYKPSLQPVQVASLGLSSGVLLQQNEPTAWAQAFGGKRERDADGDVMAYGHSHYGVNFGYELDVQDRRVGLMAGFARSKVESDITSFDTETDNFYIGGYGHFDLGSVNLTASLIGGYNNYDHKRYVFDNINGLETASSDFDGTFLSPSVTVSAAYPLRDGFELRPSLNLAYNIA